MFQNCILFAIGIPEGMYRTFDMSQFRGPREPCIFSGVIVIMIPIVGNDEARTPLKQAFQARPLLVLTMVSFALCMSVGCNTANSFRYDFEGKPQPGHYGQNSALERLTYAQHAPRVSQQKTNQPTGMIPNNRPEYSLPVVQANDPPEIVELAGLLNETERFPDEEKEELLERLRQESPVMRASMIANLRATLRSTESKKYPADDNANPIMQVTYQSPAEDMMTQEPPRRLINFADSNGKNTVERNAWEQSGMIRQVSDTAPGNQSSVRINRLQSELAPPPRLSDDGDDWVEDESEISEPRHHAADLPPRMAQSLSDASRESNREDNAGIETRKPQTRIGFADPTSTGRPTGSNTSEVVSRANRTNVTSITTPSVATETISRFVPNTTSFAISEALPENLETSVEGRQMRDDDYDAVADDNGTEAYRRSMQESTPEQHVRIASAQHRPEKWDETLRHVINSLDLQTAGQGTPSHNEQLQAEINQRILHLVLGNQRDAIRPIDGLSAELQEFWRNELLGLSTMLDDASIPDDSHRFAVAQHHLQSANLHLQSLCPVRIKNINFINQCDGFGVYETAKNEFRQGEPIFVYAEIDNLICREQENGYHTQVSSSYEIVDVLGNKVANGEFSKTGKYTQSRIRDAFLLWRVDLPENVMSGKYFLRISVSDLNHPNHQVDQQSLELNMLVPLRNN